METPWRLREETPTIHPWSIWKALGKRLKDKSWHGECGLQCTTIIGCTVFSVFHFAFPSGKMLRLVFEFFFSYLCIKFSSRLSSVEPSRSQYLYLEVSTVGEFILNCREKPSIMQYLWSLCIPRLLVLSIPAVTATLTWPWWLSVTVGDRRAPAPRSGGRQGAWRPSTAFWRIQCTCLGGGDLTYPIFNNFLDRFRPLYFEVTEFLY